MTVVEAEHRQHAVVELVIRDLKDKRSRTSPPVSFTPTAPGPCSARSHTTCCAGQNYSAHPAASSMPHHPCRPHHPPQAARHPRPPDDARRPLDATPARPLALATGLHRRADAPPSASRRRLSAPATPKQPAHHLAEPARSRLPANPDQGRLTRPRTANVLKHCAPRAPKRTTDPPTTFSGHNSAPPRSALAQVAAGI
jgi:hypothetical protein